ncbi:MAG: DUF433 domain-containing protein [Myxococcales bacterium]|nr:DUF433 domain-containing protein [Myxococcales bacterium]
MTAPSDIYGGRRPEDVPAYSLPEAAALAGVPASTLRAWVVGRRFPARGGEGWSHPVVPLAKDEQRFLSFTNLVEVCVRAAMRRKHALSSLARIEYDERGRAVRLFPSLRRTDAARSIVIDPLVAFGRPVIAGTAVPAADIRARFDAGDSVLALAADFEVAPEQIEDALRATKQAA